MSLRLWRFRCCSWVVKTSCCPAAGGAAEEAEKTTLTLSSRAMADNKDGCFNKVVRVLLTLALSE